MAHSHRHHHHPLSEAWLAPGLKISGWLVGLVAVLLGSGHVAYQGGETRCFAGWIKFGSGVTPVLCGLILVSNPTPI